MIDLPPAIHGSLSGFTKWELLDTPERDRRVLDSGQHSNLITNAGLDAFGVESALGASSPGSNAETQQWGAFRQVLWLGTGSNAPAFTDTTLTNPVKGTGNNGGFWAEQSLTGSVAGGVLTMVSRQVRVVDIVTAANFTEYALAPSAGAVSVSIRELFRDAGGTPVVVPGAPGQQVKVTHDLTVSLPFAATPKTLDLGTGVKNTNQTFFSSTTNQSDYRYASAIMVPGLPTQNLYGYTAADTGSPTVQAASTLITATHSVLAYVNGTYQRTKRVVIDPASGNMTYFGWLWTPTGISTNGFKVAYNGTSQAKTNTQRLTLDLTLGWGRA